MKLKQYLNEKSAKQIKKEWEKWSIKRQNLLATGKSREYKEARKKELELAHQYWKLTGFEFQGLGQMPFESIQESSNEEEFDMLDNMRLSFDIKAGNEFFLSVGNQNSVSDKQLQTAKNILKKNVKIKKLIKMAKSMTWEEAQNVSVEKLKKRDIKGMGYYCLLSSPLHHEMLRKI